MSEQFLLEDAAVPHAPNPRPLKLPFPRDCPIHLDLNPELAASPLSLHPAHIHKSLPSGKKHSVLAFLRGRQQTPRGEKE